MFAHLALLQTLKTKLMNNKENSSEGNDIIEFEGVKIKPSRGIYRCPFNCHRSDYPAPKWKTKQGIMKHLQTCSKRPSNIKRLSENKEVEDMIFDRYKKEALNMVTHQIGQTIYWVRKIIVKDTHEWRGSRLVKMRYEQILRFEAVESVINSIDIIKRSNYTPTAEYLLKNCLYFNGVIPIQNLRSSLDEAKKEAIESTKRDEEYRHESSMFR